ncbi:MAG TPA: adenylate/guanylate cyclase domain-containing protein [Fontimonas sp.]
MTPRAGIDAQAFTVLGCRLLALAMVIVMLTLMAGAAAAHRVTPVEAVTALMLLLAAAALWLSAASLAAQLVERLSLGTQRLPEPLPRWIVVLTGLLLAVTALAPLAQLSIAAIVPLLSGLALAAAAKPLAAWLLPDEQTPIDAVVAVEQQSVTELLGGLVNASAALGIRRATDLALSIKSEAEGVAKRVVRGSLDAMIAAVEQRRPDFSASTAADGTVTIAFSDMEGFTAMTQRLGDAAAHQVIKAHNHIVRRALRAHGGQEVELQGDGFLLAFADPAQALQCSTVIQQQCAEYSRRHPDTPIRVRIGLHCGTPIKEGDRFFGITVILAARIAAQAQGGEVLVSDALHAAVGNDASFAFGASRVAELKGLSGTHRMHPLVMQGIA